MKQFLAFVQKEFYHIMRDKRTVLILLVMPIVYIILFGFALSTEVKNVRVAVCSSSYDDAARTIIDRFNANNYFSVTQIIDDPTLADELFRENKIDMAMVFESRFNENILHSYNATVQFILDGTDPNAASMTLGYASSIITDYQKELMVASGGSAPFLIMPTVKLLYNPQMKSAYNFVPGVMGLILMLICAMMTSISIVREKERGTMEVLLVSPIRPIYIILAKAVPYLTLSAVNLTTILLLSIFLLNVPIAGSLIWLAVISLIFIFVALSLGLLISSLVKTQVAAMLASGLVLMMPTVVLSGMIFPVENMPDILQGVSAIIPARWYIVMVKKIMIQGLPIYYVMKELIIISVMAVILISVSLKKFKHRLE